MNLIERYLGRVLVSHTLVVMLVLLIILGFSEFMIQLGKVSETYTLNKGILYTLLKLPVFGYEIFPIAILIGTLLGLGGLANHAELTILRVTGWSIKRIFWGVMKSAFMLWLAVAILGEFVAPKAEAYAKKMRGEALNANFSLGSSDGLWMRDGQRIIYVGRLASDKLLLDVNIYTLEKGEIKTRLHAARAEFKDKKWLMKDIEEVQLGWQPNVIKGNRSHYWRSLHYQETHEKSQTEALPLTPKLLDSLNVERRYMGITDLYHYIHFLDENDLDSESYKLAFWRKIATPLVILGMIALVFPLIFGSQRQVSIGQRVFVGIMIGMSFHLLNQIFGNLSVVYHLPAMLGAFFPSVVLLSLALYLFRRLR